MPQKCGQYTEDMPTKTGPLLHDLPKYNPIAVAYQRLLPDGHISFRHACYETLHRQTQKFQGTEPLRLHHAM